MNLLNDWVLTLPMQQQAVLALACRGCDGVPKEHSSKPIVRYLRGLIMRSAWFGRELAHNERAGDFMVRPGEYRSGDYIDAVQAWLPDIEAMPMHYVTHTMHAIEIVGYKHPDANLRAAFMKSYALLVHSLHLQMETEDMLDNRLCDWHQKHWEVKENA